MTTLRSSHCTCALVALVAMLAGCRGAGQKLGLGGPPRQERFDLARLHEKDGQLVRARDLYMEMHRRDRTDAQVCQRLGVVSALLGDHEASDGYFEQAIAQNPNDVEVLTDHGYSLASRGNFEQAEVLLKRAVAIDSRNKRAVNNLGLVVGYQGRMDEAFQHFRRVNDEASAHANVAYVQAQLGKGGEAIDRFSRALEINPDHEASQQGLLELARIEERHREMHAGGRFAKAERESGKPTTGEIARVDHVEPAKPEPVTPPVATTPDPTPEIVARPATPATATPENEFDWAEDSASPTAGEAPIQLAGQTSDRTGAPPAVRPAGQSVDAETQPGGVRWQHLQISFDRHGGKAGAFAVLERALLALARDEPFEQVVADYSDGPNPQAGGQVGWTTAANAAPEVREALEKLPVGKLSRVISGETAYHVIRVVERRSDAGSGWVARAENSGVAH